MLKGRLEDDRMLTGRGKYVSDWNLPGQAYGHFVRSDRAHAQIVSIGKEQTLAHPGVIAVFTGEDIKAALKSLPCALPVKGRGGMELIHPGRPALAQGRVRFAGDAVALVVAESAVAAQDASELLNIEYRDLPAVVRAEDAVKPGAALVHDSVPGNLVMDFESGDDAGSKAAFARAARTIELEVDISRVVGNPMEPRACLAHFDTSADQHHLYTCTQCAGIMRNQLSAVLRLPPDTSPLTAASSSGGFAPRRGRRPVVRDGCSCPARSSAGWSTPRSRSAGIRQHPGGAFSSASSPARSPRASSTTRATSPACWTRPWRRMTGRIFPREGKRAKSVAGCAGAACRRTSKRPARASRRRTRSSCAGAATAG